MKRISLISLLILGLSNAFAQTKSNWSPTQTIKHKVISTVRVSPDGGKVVYAVKELKTIEGKSEFINHLFPETYCLFEKIIIQRIFFCAIFSAQCRGLLSLLFIFIIDYYLLRT